MQLTVVQLKDELHQRTLSVSVSKLELINRLDVVDPNRQWIEDILSYSMNSTDLDPNNRIQDNEDQDELRMNEIDETRSSRIQNVQARSISRTPSLTTHYENGESIAQKEIDLMRRENELLRRELEFARKQYECTPLEESRTVHVVPEEVRPRESIQSLFELVSNFDGSEDTFSRWERQIKLLCNIYSLDDNRAKLLISNKLKGKAKNGSSLKMQLS